MIWWIWAIWGTIFNFRETMDPPGLAANDNNQELARVGYKTGPATRSTIGSAGASEVARSSGQSQDSLRNEQHNENR